MFNDRGIEEAECARERYKVRERQRDKVSDSDEVGGGVKEAHA